MSDFRRELLTKLGFTLDRKGLQDAERAVGETMTHIKKNSAALTGLASQFSKISGWLLNHWTLGIGAIVGGIGAMTSFAEKTAESNHEMEMLSFKTGMAMSKLTGLKKISTESGVPFETMNMALGRMTYTLGRNQGRLAEMGFHAKDAGGAIIELADKFEKIEDPSKRAQLGMMTFGRQWQTMVPLLERGPEAIKAAMDAGKVNPELLAKYKELHQTNKAMAAVWGAIRKSLGDIVIGPLATWTKSSLNTLKEVKEVVAALSTKAIAMIKAFDHSLDESGFYAAISEIKKDWSEFVKSIKDGTGASLDLSSILAFIADLVSNTIWAMQIIVALTLKGAAAAYNLLPPFKTLWGIIKAVGIGMAFAYGAPMLLRIALVTAGLFHQVAAWVALNVQLLWANTRMAAQGGILTVLQLGWDLLTGGIFRGIGAMRLFGASSIGALGAIGAALAVLYWSFNRIMDALEERSQRIQQEQYDAARGQIEDELQKRLEALNAAKKTGDKAKIEAAQKHYDVLAKTYRKEWVDKKDRPGDKPDGSDISVQIKSAGEGMQASMARDIQNSEKNTTINNKLNFNVTAKSKGGGTGLSAGDVTTLAHKAAQSVLSMQLISMMDAQL